MPEFEFSPTLIHEVLLFFFKDKNANLTAQYPQHKIP